MPEPRPAFPKQAKRRTRKEPTRVCGSTRAEERAAKRAAHALETAALREAVFRRANDCCELCRESTPTEMHHLVSGSGKRRQQQSERTTVAVCGGCHRRWHRVGAAAFVWAVREWAERHGYAVPISITRVV